MEARLRKMRLELRNQMSKNHQPVTLQTEEAENEDL